MENKSPNWVPYTTVLALLISVFSIGISFRQALGDVFKPRESHRGLSYVVVWRFSSNNDGKVTDVALTPAFWLQNDGARSVVIKDVRIIFRPKGQAEILSFPVSSVPRDAIESSTEFHEYGRISTGSPFRSFGLAKSEVWVSSYRFSVKSISELVGEVPIAVQVSTGDDPDWTTVFSDSLDFGSQPYHSEPMFGGVQSIPVYTRRWGLRTTDRPQ